jgi:hypothetical protein
LIAFSFIEITVLPFKAGAVRSRQYVLSVECSGGQAASRNDENLAKVHTVVT